MTIEKTIFLEDTRKAPKNQPLTTLTMPPIQRKEKKFKAQKVRELEEKISALPQQDPVQTIVWKDLRRNKWIGHGGEAEVYRGKWLEIDVAIKKLHSQPLSATLSPEFEHEVNILALCQSPNIVRFYGICIAPESALMVMEYLSKGSLFHVLHDKKECLPWNPVRWCIAIDIGKGLRYIHSQKIIHHDLKSLNVLLDKRYQAKICDFGLSQELEDDSSVKKPPTKGTIRWRAPELFRSSTVSDFTSDIYSYGMVLWEIASRRFPFDTTIDDAVARDWIEQGEQENIPQNCPKMYGNIIQQCWDAPDKRPTAEALTVLLATAESEERVPTLNSKSKPESKRGAREGLQPPQVKSLKSSLDYPGSFFSSVQQKKNKKENKEEKKRTVQFGKRDAE